MTEYFRYFVVPFYFGTFFLLVTLAFKYVTWFSGLTRGEQRLFWRSLPTKATWKSIKEVIGESLFHRKIWCVNPMLGYMHTTFSLGWFLLIAVGWLETILYFKGESVPLYVDIFFSYYVHPVFERNFNFSLIKDALLLLLLIGIGLALFKRIRSRVMGLKRTTKHILGDRIALTALWTIFPARLLAESLTGAEVFKFGGYVWAFSSDAQVIPPGIGCGSFLTGTLGEWLAGLLPAHVVEAQTMELSAWWLYSVALGIFFMALPFSRYMHIFTEIPLIFLRNAGLRTKGQESRFDRFQTDACSRCGICIDPCQLQSGAGIDNVQSVYFLRDRRHGKLVDTVADNCLMCGRCETVCPVGIELNGLRLNSRRKRACKTPAPRYTYIAGTDHSQGKGTVGYFAGCMTLLTPRILHAMEKIFDAAGERVWWADRNGGICCGRPLKLSGEIDAAHILMKQNGRLFAEHNIRTLITSCPICLKVFKEDYDLPGVEVLHHSEYIARLVAAGRLEPAAAPGNFTYHDPCELGRGGGIYDAPRQVLTRFGTLTEPAETRENALCCGSSLANTAIGDEGQRRISRQVAEAFSATSAECIVTACPLCKKGIGRESTLPVYDLAEVVARHI